MQQLSLNKSQYLTHSKDEKFNYNLLSVVCLFYLQQLKSPNQEFEMNFSLQSDGTPTYALQYKKTKPL
jgi:hypothetical protein